MARTTCTRQQRPPRPPGLAIGTLNIQDGWSFGLTQAIWAVERRGFDVMLLTKTRIPATAYCRNLLGYEVTFFAAQPTSSGGSQGGVGVVTRERPFGRGIYSTHYHRPNMASCEIITGLTRTPLVGTYLPPSTVEHLPELEEVLQLFRDPIFLRDLNMDLNKSRRPQSQQVADLLTDYGIIYLVRHFRQSYRFHNLKTWSQFRQETVFRLIFDYIIGTDRRRLELLGICDMRNFSSDHFALRPRLLRRPTCCHPRYLRGRKEFPLRLRPSE